MSVQTEEETGTTCVKSDARKRMLRIAAMEGIRALRGTLLRTVSSSKNTSLRNRLQACSNA